MAAERGRAASGSAGMARVASSPGSAPATDGPATGAEDGGVASSTAQRETPSPGGAVDEAAPLRAQVRALIRAASGLVDTGAHSAVAPEIWRALDHARHLVEQTEDTAAAHAHHEDHVLFDEDAVVDWMRVAGAGEKVDAWERRAAACMRAQLQLERVRLPVRVGRLTVLSLGRICRRPGFHTAQDLFPIGFRSRRQYACTEDPARECEYESVVEEGGDAPLFAVYCVAGDGSTVLVERQPSSTQAWAGVQSRVNAAVEERSLDAALRRTQRISGPVYFGFRLKAVARMLEGLPGAVDCAQYSPQELRGSYPEADVLGAVLGAGRAQEGLEEGEAAAIARRQRRLQGQVRRRDAVYRRRLASLQSQRQRAEQALEGAEEGSEERAQVQGALEAVKAEEEQLRDVRQRDRHEEGLAEKAVARGDARLGGTTARVAISDRRRRSKQEEREAKQARRAHEKEARSQARLLEQALARQGREHRRLVLERAEARHWKRHARRMAKERSARRTCLGREGMALVHRVASALEEADGGGGEAPATGCLDDSLLGPVRGEGEPPWVRWRSPVSLCRSVSSDFLQCWVFLSRFGPRLGCPLVGVPALERAVLEPAACPLADAVHLALLRPLYEHAATWLALDEAQAQTWLDSRRRVLNAATWPEYARLLLLAHAAKARGVPPTVIHRNFNASDSAEALYPPTRALCLSPERAAADLRAVGVAATAPEQHVCRPAPGVESALTEPGPEGAPFAKLDPPPDRRAHSQTVAFIRRARERAVGQDSHAAAASALAVRGVACARVLTGMLRRHSSEGEPVTSQAMARALSCAGLHSAPPALETLPGTEGPVTGSGSSAPQPLDREPWLCLLHRAAADEERGRAIDGADAMVMQAFASAVYRCQPSALLLMLVAFSDCAAAVHARSTGEDGRQGTAGADLEWLQGCGAPLRQGSWAPVPARIRALLPIVGGDAAADAAHVSPLRLLHGPAGSAGAGAWCTAPAHELVGPWPCTRGARVDAGRRTYRPRPVSLLQPADLACHAVVAALARDPDSSAFREPISTLLFPPYATAVQRPLDLHTLAVRVRCGANRGCIEAFAADLALVWRNCAAFNDASSPLVASARRLAGKGRRLLAQAVAQLPQLGDCPRAGALRLASADHGALDPWLPVSTAPSPSATCQRCAGAFPALSRDAEADASPPPPDLDPVCMVAEGAAAAAEEDVLARALDLVKGLPRGRSVAEAVQARLRERDDPDLPTPSPVTKQAGGEAGSTPVFGQHPALAGSTWVRALASGLPRPRATERPSDLFDARALHPICFGRVPVPPGQGANAEAAPVASPAAAVAAAQSGSPEELEALANVLGACEYWSGVGPAVRVRLLCVLCELAEDLSVVRAAVDEAAAAEARWRESLQQRRTAVMAGEEAAGSFPWYGDEETDPKRVVALGEHLVHLGCAAPNSLGQQLQTWGEAVAEVSGGGGAAPLENVPRRLAHAALDLVRSLRAEEASEAARTPAPQAKGAGAGVEQQDPVKAARDGIALKRRRGSARSESPLAKHRRTSAVGAASAAASTPVGEVLQASAESVSRPGTRARRPRVTDLVAKLSVRKFELPATTSVMRAVLSTLSPPQGYKPGGEEWEEEVTERQHANKKGIRKTRIFIHKADGRRCNTTPMAWRHEQVQRFLGVKSEWERGRGGRLSVAAALHRLGVRKEAPADEAPAADLVDAVAGGRGGEEAEGERGEGDVPAAKRARVASVASPAAPARSEGTEEEEEEDDDTTEAAAARRRLREDAHRKARQYLLKCSFPRKMGVFEVQEVGRLDPRPAYSTPRHVWPVGYRVRRPYCSLGDPREEREYEMEVADGGDDGPRFRITCPAYGSLQIDEPSATAAWKELLRRVQERRQTLGLAKEAKKRQLAAGPESFGLGMRRIEKLIEGLPGALELRAYSFHAERQAARPSRAAAVQSSPAPKPRAAAASKAPTSPSPARAADRGASAAGGDSAPSLEEESPAQHAARDALARVGLLALSKKDMGEASTAELESAEATLLDDAAAASAQLRSAKARKGVEGQEEEEGEQAQQAEGKEPGGGGHDPVKQVELLLRQQRSLLAATELARVLKERSEKEGVASAGDEGTEEDSGEAASLLECVASTASLVGAGVSLPELSGTHSRWQDPGHGRGVREAADQAVARLSHPSCPLCQCPVLPVEAMEAACGGGGGRLVSVNELPHGALPQSRAAAAGEQQLAVLRSWHEARRACAEAVAAEAKGGVAPAVAVLASEQCVSPEDVGGAAGQRLLFHAACAAFLDRVKAAQDGDGARRKALEGELERLEKEELRRQDGTVRAVLLGEDRAGAQYMWLPHTQGSEIQVVARDGSWHPVPVGDGASVLMAWLDSRGWREGRLRRRIKALVAICEERAAARAKEEEEEEEEARRARVARKGEDEGGTSSQARSEAATEPSGGKDGLSPRNEGGMEEEEEGGSATGSSDSGGSYGRSSGSSSISSDEDDEEEENEEKEEGAGAVADSGARNGTGAPRAEAAPPGDGNGDDTGAPAVPEWDEWMAAALACPTASEQLLRSEHPPLSGDGEDDEVALVAAREGREEIEEVLDTLHGIHRAVRKAKGKGDPVAWSLRAELGSASVAGPAASLWMAREELVDLRRSVESEARRKGNRGERERHEGRTAERGAALIDAGVATTAVAHLRVVLREVEACLPAAATERVSLWRQGLRESWHATLEAAVTPRQILACLLVLEHLVPGEWVSRWSKQPPAECTWRIGTSAAVAARAFAFDATLSYTRVPKDVSVMIRSKRLLPLPSSLERQARKYSVRDR